MTISEFKNRSVKLLEQTSPSAALDVEVFLEHSLNFSKTKILLNRDKEIPEENLLWLNAAVEKRMTGLPVAYITGHKEFYGYDFLVSPEVLIPKPDTEILVERALELIGDRIDSNPETVFSVCDMCSGSGCIGISVLKSLIEDYDFPVQQLPKMVFADISKGALEMTEKNARMLLDLENNPELKEKIKYVRTNLFEMVPWRFDYILTNPPYIPHSMVDELLKDGRNEPRLALDGDISAQGDRAVNSDGSEKDDGLEIIRNLLPEIKKHLNPNGVALMETGEYNAEKAAEVSEGLGFSSKILKDLEGQLRVLELK